MAKIELTDTDRLEWMMVHGSEFDSDRTATKWWVRWYGNSHWHVARGTNQRECIDAAIRGEGDTF